MSPRVLETSLKAFSCKSKPSNLPANEQMKDRNVECCHDFRCRHLLCQNNQELPRHRIKPPGYSLSKLRASTIVRRIKVSEFPKLLTATMASDSILPRALNMQRVSAGILSPLFVAEEAQRGSSAAWLARAQAHPTEGVRHLIHFQNL
jgi:hypothetical protein